MEVVNNESDCKLKGNGLSKCCRNGLKRVQNWREEVGSEGGGSSRRPHLAIHFLNACHGKMDP